jgi:hypothetical protein
VLYQWSGATLTFTSGVNAGRTTTVSANTATTLTFGALPSAPAPGDAYSLFEVNEPHMLKGSDNAVFIATQNDIQSLTCIWFPAAGGGIVTAPTSVSYAQYGGHSDTGQRAKYTLNPDGSYSFFQVYTDGTSPGVDGGTWSGTVSNYYGTGPADSVDGTPEYHWCTAWNQSGATVGTEWAAKDSAGDEYNAVTANGWSVDSGNVYKTACSFSSNTRGGATRGVNGVVLWNGTVGVGSQITGSLTAAASRAAMVAGTFFWNSGTSTLYAWMPTGIAPTASNVILQASQLATQQIVYMREDGSSIRSLCWIYSDTQDMINNYSAGPYVNVSPDGLLAVVNMDFGNYANNNSYDIVAIEVPTS